MAMAVGTEDPDHITSCVCASCFQEFSRFHVEITPMLERLLNNRKQWNALKEVHEAKMAVIEEAKKAKEEATPNVAAAKQGASYVLHHHTTNLSFSLILCYNTAALFIL